LSQRFTSSYEPPENIVAILAAAATRSASSIPTEALRRGAAYR
jgi:hypothetical protein